MGVPAFFRWLTRKYPSVVVECIEEQPTLDKNGQPIPIDASEKNPNGVEFDNFYLDMNGIIHPCTHPENKPAPKNENEMMVAIFECIDRLFKIVRPRKLLYLAIDGVAPRAKMNQQRSRRFRAAKETEEKAEQIAAIRSQLEAKGIVLPPAKDKSSSFDSNCITPGTEFMSRLTDCLNYFIHDKLNNDPGWKGLKVILSDASVPGEGEHKIMDFIRRQRGLEGHDPNTHHCLCGADADLIMLGLATHEPYFTIIREEFIMNQAHRCEICAQTGHEMKECKGLPNLSEEMDTMALPPSVTRYIFVRLNVLREYLEDELKIHDVPFKFDFERAIDDWVFMCFFVGNDFLPHLPSLEIREGAIDRLITLYKRAVVHTGGFLTDSGDVNLHRVEVILNDLGTAEDEIFRKRHRNDVMFRGRNRQKQIQERMSKPQYQSMTEEEIIAQLEKDDPEPLDDVRLWDDGYKDRYYSLKFNLPPNDISTRHHIGVEYARGLCWVLKYYYQGCASWDWFFPFHYAPFASDIVNLEQSLSEFAKGTQPFSPLEQLMGVFPAASGTLVPSAWADLMTNLDSTVLDFYPIDFMIDLNGKKFAWQGVALLPFVDEVRLRQSLKPYYHLLTKDEKKRNERGNDRLYVCRGADCFEFISVLGRKRPKEICQLKSDGISGSIFMDKSDFFQGNDVISPIPGLDILHGNEVYCVRFEDPKYKDDHKFFANRLEGTRDPPRIILSKDKGNTGFRGRGRRPIIGMVPRNDQASLSDSAHRSLRHYIPTDHAAPLGRPGTSSNNFHSYNRGRGQDFMFRKEPSAVEDLTHGNDGEMSGSGRGRGLLMSKQSHFGGHSFGRGGIGHSKNLERSQKGSMYAGGDNYAARGRGGHEMNQSRSMQSDRFRPRHFGNKEDFGSSSHDSGNTNIRSLFARPPDSSTPYDSGGSNPHNLLDRPSESDLGIPISRRGFGRNPKYEKSESGGSFSSGGSMPRRGFGHDEHSEGGSSSRVGYAHNPKFEQSKGGGPLMSGNKSFRRGFDRGGPYEQSGGSSISSDRGDRGGFRRPPQRGYGRGQRGNRGGNEFAIAGGIITKDEN